LHPQCVEQDRLFDDLAREDPLGEAADKDGVEAQAARRLDRTHKHLAVAPRRRDRPFEQQRPKETDHIAQRNRTDRRDRRQLGKHREHPVATSERAGGETAQPVEPLALVDQG
jgi:hypothetical protein